MPDLQEVVTPYPGLRPFTSSEGVIFRGREEHTDRLLDILQQQRFLAVIGPSGSGKSSLVRAGLLPALPLGAIGLGTNWRVASMRPGNRPMQRLSQALLTREGIGLELVGADGIPESDREITRDVEAIEAELRRGPLGLVDLVADAVVSSTEPFNLLVLVDQFEELFTYSEAGTRQEDESEAFVNLLLASRSAKGVSIFVALTMRTDFIGHCVRFLDLPDAINRAQYLTPRLSRKQARLAIAGPARVFGGDIEPDLVEELINDVGNDPDQLPILQHALRRMWDFASKRNPEQPKINWGDYHLAGGVRRALSSHADQVLTSLGPEQEPLAEILFRAVTHHHGADDGQAVRRPQTLGQIADWSGRGWTQFEPVLTAFAQLDVNFLNYSGKLERDTVVDISHEALIRQWEKLRQWVISEARRADDYRRWKERRAEFVSDPRALLTGGALTRAVEWLEGADSHSFAARWRPTKEWATRYDARPPTSAEGIDRPSGVEFPLVREFIELSRTEKEVAEKRVEQERLQREEAERTRLDEQRLAAERLAATEVQLRAEAERSATEQRARAESESKQREQAHAYAKRVRAISVLLALALLVTIAAFVQAYLAQRKASQSAATAVAAAQQARGERDRADTAQARTLAALEEANRLKTEADQARVTAEVAAEQARLAQSTADQRGLETRVVRTTAGFGGRETHSPQDRQALWELATGPVEFRRAVLKGFFASSAPQERFVSSNAIIMQALLGYGPVERMQPIAEALDEQCVRVPNPPGAACSILAGAVAVAPDTLYRQQLAERVVRVAETRLDASTIEPPLELGWMMRLLNRNQLDGLVRRAIDRNKALELWTVLGTTGQSLDVLRDQMSPAVRQSLGDAYLERFEKEYSGQLANRFQIGLLNESQRDRFARTVSVEWSRIPQFSRPAFAAVADRLTQDQRVEIGTQLFLERFGGEQALSDFIARTDADTIRILGNVLTTRLESAQPSIAPLNDATWTIGERLDPEQYRRISLQLLKLLDASGDSVNAFPLANAIGRMGAARRVDPTMFADVLNHAVQRIQYSNLISPAIGSNPGSPTVHALVTALVANPKQNGRIDYGSRAGLVDVARQTEPGDIVWFIDAVAPADLAAFEGSALPDVLPAFPPGSASIALRHAIDRLKNGRSVGEVTAFAEALSRMGDRLRVEFATEATTALVAKMAAFSTDHYSAGHLLEIAIRICPVNDKAIRTNLIVAALSAMDRESPSAVWFAIPLATLAAEMEGRQWQAVLGVLVQAFEAEQKSGSDRIPYQLVRIGGALASAADRLTVTQRSLAFVPLFDLMQQKGALLEDPSIAVQRLFPRLPDEQKRQCLAFVQAAVSEAETIGEASSRETSDRRDDLARVISRFGGFLNATGRSRAARALARLIRLGNQQPFSRRGWDMALAASFAGQLDQASADLLTAAIVDNVVNGSPYESRETLAILVQFPAARGREKQFLVDLLRRPDLSLETRRTLTEMLAETAGVSPATLDVDRWRFAEWARRQGLDISPLPRPATM